MFAVVHLPHFALQAALRHEPDLWMRPVALVDPALSTPRVCDATLPARALGVTDGLTPTQALARCRDVLMRHRSTAQEAAATDALLQCAYGFSPNIENTSPGIVTLDLHGLAELAPALESAPREGTPPTTFCRPGLLTRRPSDCASAIEDSHNLIRDRRDACPTLAWAQRLHGALASLNLRACIGVGATPNLARHAAQASSSRRVEEADSPNSPSAHVEVHQAISIVTEPSAFVAGLPITALEPSTDVTLILGKWGIRTVGELLALGPDAVVDRLGLEALALFAAASTRALRPLHLVRPAEHYEEMFEFEHEIETVEPLLFILRRFVDYLSQRLELSGLVAALLTLRLRLESGEAIERRLRLPQPTRQADVLFRMLQTHLEMLRTDSAIVAVSLKADPTQPQQKQFGLFEAALRDPQQFQETLARLSALVGAERVGTPVREESHRPDAFKLVPPDFENAPDVLRGGTPELLRAAPLRRFRPALKASVATESIADRAVPESPPPLSLRCSVAQGKLIVALGPWRASGRWWEPGAWQREEWDVETSRGVALRLVQRPEGWFVEGLAD